LETRRIDNTILLLFPVFYTLFPGGQGSPVVKHIIVPSLDNDHCHKIYKNITIEWAYPDTICEEQEEIMNDEERGTHDNENASSGDDPSCTTVWHNGTYHASENVTQDMMCAGWLSGGLGNCQVWRNNNINYYSECVGK